MPDMSLASILENIRGLAMSMSYEQFCQKLGIDPLLASSKSKHRGFVNIGTALGSISPTEVVKLLGSSVRVINYPMASSYPHNPYSGPENSLVNDDKTASRVTRDLISYFSNAKQSSLDGVRARHYAICATELENVLFRLNSLE